MWRLILVMLANSALASEHWLCKEATSLRRGNDIEACGVATNADLSIAKNLAFDNAKSEFNKVCGNSADCYGHQISVNPKRTTCDTFNGAYTCYRLLEFNIGKIKTRLASTFQSYEPEQDAQLPKIRRGMAKADVLKIFGAPQSIYVEDIIGNYTQLIYTSDDICQGGMGCGIIIENGIVASYAHIKYQYTNDL